MTTTGRVEAVEPTQNGVIVRLSLDEVGGDPIAPGWCGWPSGQLTQDTLVLHRLLGRHRNVVSLESLDRPTSMPALGAEVEYTSWWTPDQLRLVTDTAKQWERRPANATSVDDIDYCDFCGLCWARIAELPIAYQSNSDWICPDCFGRYIESDLLGIR
jgi:hypothetical protein